MGNVVTNFIAPLKIHYRVPEPAESDPMAFFEDMRKDLARFDDETLKKAAVVIRQTREESVYFPSIAYCIRVCKDTQGAEALKKPLNDGKREGFGTDYASKRADKLIRCDLGRHAAREGWITRLWEYCRDNGNLPEDERDVRNMISAHKALEKDWKELIDSGKAMACVLSARKSLLAKRTILSRLTGEDIVHHDELKRSEDAA